MTSYSMRDYGPSLAVISKARSYLAQERVHADSETGVFWVQGSARKPHRVQGDFKTYPSGKITCSWIMCTCEWGRRQGAGASACSHAVAALLAIREGMRLPQTDRPTETL